MRIYSGRMVTKIIRMILQTLYIFFWVFPRRQIVVGRRFGTLYQFHLQRLCVHWTLYTQPLKMELIQGSETSVNYNLTPGKYPEENIQYSNHGESLKSRLQTFLTHYPQVLRIIMSFAVLLNRTRCEVYSWRSWRLYRLKKIVHKSVQRSWTKRRKKPRLCWQWKSNKTSWKRVN